MAIPLTITEMWAVIAKESGNDEGIVSMDFLPLVAADPAKLEKILQVAEKLSREFRKEIKVVKFTQVEIVKVFKPQS